MSRTDFGLLVLIGAVGFLGAVVVDQAAKLVVVLIDMGAGQ